MLLQDSQNVWPHGNTTEFCILFMRHFSHELMLKASLIMFIKFGLVYLNIIIL